MLLREEEYRPVFVEFLPPDQSVDRAVSLGHVEPGRFVILLRRDRCHSIFTQRNKSRTVFLLGSFFRL